MSEQDCTGAPADILLVEDNPGDVRLTREAFNEGSIANTLHAVGDGTEALNFLYQRGEYADAPCPDNILLDLNLPRKNGDDVHHGRARLSSRTNTAGKRHTTRSLIPAEYGR